MKVQEFITAIEEGKTVGCLGMTIRKRGRYIVAMLPSGGFEVNANKIEISKSDPEIVNLIYEDEFAGLPYTALKGSLMPSEWKVIQ